VTDRIPPDLAASLVLVRHGESTWIVEGRFQGAADPPLSERGQRQAELVAARLAEPHAPPPLPLPQGDSVGCWHSPLRRAAAVAEAIRDARPRPLALHADRRFAEIAQGDWEGRPHAEIAAGDAERYQGWRRDPTRHGGPGGEPLGDAARRVRAGIFDVVGALAAARTSAGRSAAEIPVPTGPGGGAGGHRHLPEPWGIVVAHDGALRLALLTLFDLPLERFWSFPFSLCAITVVKLHEGRPLLRAHNLAEHLASLAPREGDDTRGDRPAL
jgi:broad specificity phosphatase PhoE